MADGGQAAAAAQERRRTIARAPEVFEITNNFSTWIKQFRNYVELVNVGAPEMFRTFMSFISPECFLLVEALELTDAEKLDMFGAGTFQRIKQALRKRENKIDPGFLFRYRKQKDNESIEDYAKDLERLCQEVYPNDQNVRQNRLLIDTFIGGVKNDELAIKLLQENFQNLTQAVEAAVQYFQALQTRRFIKTETDFRPVLEKVYVTREEVTTTEKNNERVVSKQQNGALQSQSETSVNQITAKNGRSNAGLEANTANMQVPQPQQIQNFPNMLGGPQWQTVPQFSMTPQMGSQPYYSSLPQTSGMFQWGNSQPQAQQPFGTARHQNQPEPYRPPQKSDKRNIICYHCNKRGHYRNECWELARVRSGQSSQQNRQRSEYEQRYCSYCAKYGHTAEYCWLLKGQKPDNKREELTDGQSKNPFRPNC